VLASDLELEAMVDTLIDEANRRGGLDNITAIVVRIDSVEISQDDRMTASAARA
jgi:serine/threonine protein phosphatase PrpC